MDYLMLLVDLIEYTRGFACYNSADQYVGTFANPVQGLNCIML